MKSLLLTILSTIFFAACKDSGVSPTDGLPHLDNNQFAISQVDYYVYRVSSNPAIMSPSRIQRVEVGTMVDSVLDIKATVTPSVIVSNGQYRVTFSVTAAFRDTTSREETIRVRLVSESGSAVSIDTTIPTYKYPYSSTEIIATNDNIPEVVFFQDIVFVDDTLYFRPTGPHGLFKYDPAIGTAIELFPYPGGDHLAADSGIVFIDNHSFIQRWNTHTATLEEIIVRYEPGSNTFITGMDVSDGVLVVLLSTQGAFFRCRYDYRGGLVDSIPFDVTGHYLAIRAGILHRIVWGATQQILRYTFSGSQLPSFYPPVRNGDGIKFHDDFLYYCDANRRLVGRVPVADLREIP